MLADNIDFRMGQNIKIGAELNFKYDGADWL